MELRWVEDFLSLASTRSFSKSAAERNTTQSTLSRRIRALEDWIGVPLVDRRTYPVKLSLVGEQFHKDAITIVRSIYRARAASRARGLQTVAPLRFGAQHVLARHFLPSLLRRIEQKMEVGGAHIRSDNLANCIEELTNGQIDFLICYYDPSLPEFIDRQRFPSVPIATEKSIPVSAPDRDGCPLFELPGSQDEPLPYIGFSPDVPVGWHRHPAMAARKPQLHIDPLHESNMGEVIREMVMEGRGFAWLQSVLIKDDLACGKLVPAGDNSWSQEIEIRAFRTFGPGRARLEEAWDVLKEITQN